MLDKTYADTWKTRRETMGNADYSAYLSSPEWQRIRATAKKRPHYQKCWICGAIHGLEIHHRSYKWVGTEHAMRGLVAVCRTCHQKIHDYAKLKGISVRLATNRYKKGRVGSLELSQGKLF